MSGEFRINRNVINPLVEGAHQYARMANDSTLGLQTRMELIRSINHSIQLVNTFKEYTNSYLKNITRELDEITKKTKSYKSEFGRILELFRELRLLKIDNERIYDSIQPYYTNQLYTYWETDLVEINNTVVHAEQRAYDNEQIADSIREIISSMLDEIKNKSTYSSSLSRSSSSLSRSSSSLSRSPKSSHSLSHSPKSIDPFNQLGDSIESNAVNEPVNEPVNVVNEQVNEPVNVVNEQVNEPVALKNPINRNTAAKLIRNTYKQRFQKKKNAATTLQQKYKSRFQKRQSAAQSLQRTYKSVLKRRKNANTQKKQLTNKDFRRIESQTAQYVELTNSYYQRTVKASADINELHLDVTQFSKIASEQVEQSRILYGNARNALFTVKQVNTVRDKAAQRKIAIGASEEAGKVMVLAEKALKDAKEYPKLIQKIVEGKLPRQDPIAFEQIKDMLDESIQNVKKMKKEMNAKKPAKMNPLLYDKLKALSNNIIINKKYIQLNNYARLGLKNIYPITDATKKAVSHQKIKQIQESNQLTEEAMTALPQILLLSRYHIYALSSLISLIYQIQNKIPCEQLNIKQVNGFPDDIKELACIWTKE